MSEENKELQNRQPEEVVLCYTPQQQPREVVCYYEQPKPLPGKRYREISPAESGVWNDAKMKERRRHRRQWIIAGIIALAVMIGIASPFVIGLFQGLRSHRDFTPSDGDSASSIVDIWADKNTTIPRYEEETQLHLTCRTDHDDSLTPQQIFAKVNPSVVTVVAAVDKYGSIGTGVIMSEDGYILTNAHVISGGKSCWVALSNGITYDAKLVGYDENEDLAVLKAVDAEDLIPAEFGDSELTSVGDRVYAIGNPLGLELRSTFTDGIVSAIDRDIKVDGRMVNVIQTNAALNNGNSGGPLINEYGQIIGINTLKMGNSGNETEASVEGLGFALPTGNIVFVVNDILTTGSFHGYPLMGVTIVEGTSADDIPIVGVIEVTEGSGAADAGIEPGDVILAADGQDVYTTADLMHVRRDHTVGDEIVLTIWRDGETFDVAVTLHSDR